MKLTSIFRYFCFFSICTGYFWQIPLAVDAEIIITNNSYNQKPIQDISEIKTILTVPGIKIHKQKLDYILEIDLSAGAEIKFLFGDVTNTGIKQGAYGGNDPEFQRQNIQEIWQKLSPQNENLTCLINAQFFRNDQNTSTALAFPIKWQGVKITDGYAGEIEYPTEKKMLTINQDAANITDFSPTDWLNSKLPNILVSLSPDADKGILKKTGRTFLGVSDRNHDGVNETILIFASRYASQIHAKNILQAWQAKEMIMLDGGGSTQLICHDQILIDSPRTIPQFIGIFQGKSFDIGN
ncbi:MAG: hypothetical protein ACRDB1_03080 [Microcoleaceae cyanobacterium]